MITELRVQEILKELETKLITLEQEYKDLDLEVDKEDLIYRLVVYLIIKYDINTSLL